MDNIEKKFKWLVVNFSLAMLAFLVSVTLIILSIFLREWLLGIIGIIGLFCSFGLIWAWFILPSLVQPITLAKEMAVKDYIRSLEENKDKKEKSIR